MVALHRTQRPLFVEPFGLLIGLDQQWRAQGATEDEINLSAFDWDYVPYLKIGNAGPVYQRKEQVLEDNEEYRITLDPLGRRMKLIKSTATIPLPLDYPVTDMDSWLKIKPIYEFHESRINPDEIAIAKKQQDSGTLIALNIPGAFDTPRQLMGEENACLCYYLQPELMHDIISTIANTAAKVLMRLTDHITIDQISVHEDMAGKSGPLMGPVQIKEYMKPYFRQIWDLAKSKGVRIFQMDSDGNINPIMADLLDCGLTSMLPMEPAAGMDIVEIRKKFGSKFTMIGGIDKHILRQDLSNIKSELEYKMQKSMQDGSVIFGLDHRITNDTPIENYRYYVNLGREILDLLPLNPQKRSWGRMAF
jgi:uroporphyrinogen-III decarboxylase